MPAAPDPARFARQLVLPGLGLDGQGRIAAARVLVLGAGGLGSAVLPVLASGGVGTLGIVDDDVVELSNLHRQTLHTAADVGRRKVDSTAERLTPLATGTLRLHAVRFTKENARDIAADYDLVVDGSDNFETRYLANDTAVAAGIPLVWGAVSQFGGHVGAVIPGAGPDYRDLFPVQPDPSSVLSCAEGGVLPSVCGVIGSLMATEVLKILTGLGRPLSGRVTSYDGLSGRFREVEFRADTDAAERDAVEAVAGDAAPASVATSAPAAVPASAPAPPSASASTSASASASEEEPVTAQPDAGQPDEITARELDDLLTDGAPVQLVDVREPWEAEIASLPGSKLLPLGTLADRVDELDPATTVVVYCHHGARSDRARNLLRSAGLPVSHLQGGIDAWSRTVDPSLPRY
ncbi:ThiF family adenylyltransferase [Naasia sp. SYSU D00948]|uniref:ThiF family adenylyltransferase n=1 Tax=Naasia sp. SYSU D00948 TaxID=2817379 RepID=UPI001B31222D|nr:ThiF family adenylyltransferase [Naasia sp. SYSU D00948]